MLARAADSMAEARQFSNETLGSVEPLQLVALTLLCAAVGVRVVSGWQAAVLEVRAKGEPGRETGGVEGRGRGAG